MEQNEKIELSSIEITAYWWINTIKERVRELSIRRTKKDKDEAEFVRIFYNFTEKNWRNLYLELTKYIKEDVNNYIPIGNIMGIDAFNQDTAKNGHDRINEELTKILGCKIPDIRLTSDSYKDSVIYTNLFGVSVWYKSCGTRKLPIKYDISYILTGDEEELHFYNSLISTIAVLDKLDKNFSSTTLLRNVFCKEYKKVNKREETKKQLEAKFNYHFNKACEKEFLSSGTWKENYHTYFRDIDYVGLSEYMEEAQHYADVILQKSKIEEEKGYIKKLKMN